MCDFRHTRRLELAVISSTTSDAVWAVLGIVNAAVVALIVVMFRFHGRISRLEGRMNGQRRTD